MIYKSINVVNLCIVAALAVVLGHYIGPRNFLANPTLVNEHYFNIMKLHFIFLGAFSCIVLFSVGKLLKASYMLITISLFIAALINIYLVFSPEPDSTNISLAEILEPLLPFLVGGMGMLALITLSHLVWVKVKSNENT